MAGVYAAPAARWKCSGFRRAGFRCGQCRRARRFRRWCRHGIKTRWRRERFRALRLLAQCAGRGTRRVVAIARRSCSLCAACLATALLVGFLILQLAFLCLELVCFCVAFELGLLRRHRVAGHGFGLDRRRGGCFGRCVRLGRWLSRRRCSDALLRFFRHGAVLVPHLRTDAIGESGRQYDSRRRAHRGQPARTYAPWCNRRACLREDRRVELRIRLVLGQTPIERGDARIVAEERFEFAIELVVAAAHSASFSRIFASA